MALTFKEKPIIPGIPESQCHFFYFLLLNVRARYENIPIPLCMQPIGKKMAIETGMIMHWHK